MPLDAHMYLATPLILPDIRTLPISRKQNNKHVNYLRNYNFFSGSHVVFVNLSRPRPDNFLLECKSCMHAQVQIWREGRLLWKCMQNVRTPPRHTPHWKFSAASCFYQNYDLFCDTSSDLLYFVVENETRGVRRICLLGGFVGIQQFGDVKSYTREDF